MTREDPAAFAPPPAFGPFRVLHQIGVGALGPVFRTYEPTRDRLIAVKVFRLDITPEQAEALSEELSKAADAGLFHPSIVEPVAAGLEGTVAYRAEEYVAAESLDVAIRHYAPAPLDKVLPFITQLAGAIDFARASGIGHGALHLRDIFVTPEEARASGFGVVEALERVGVRAPVRRPYSAPERIAGDDWGTPADVFSLAAITYELLTARRPAGTGAQAGSISAAEAGDHAVDVGRVLARAMDDDPAARFPSALAFVSALEAAARGEYDGDAAPPLGAAAAGAGAAAFPEEEDFAVEPEPIDDIGVERDDDTAFHDLAEQDRLAREAEEGHRVTDSLFGDEGEAAEDLALEAPPERFTDLAEADEPAPASVHDEFVEEVDVDHPADRLHAAAAGSLLARDEVYSATDTVDDTVHDTVHEDVQAGGRLHAGEEMQTSMRYGDPEAIDRGDADVGYGRGRVVTPAYETVESEREAPVVGPPRGSVLPGAIGLMIGLLLGLAAGWALWGGSAVVPPDAVQSSADSSTAQPSDSAAQALPSDTEQPVTLPGAPDVPDEVPPAEAAPPPPAATTGSLVINSTPAKAAVTINGQWRGRTPLTLDEQPFGTYNIRIVQDGFQVVTERVVLSSSAPSRTVAVQLTRAAPAAAAKPPAAAAKPPAPPRTSPPASQQPTVFQGSIYVDSRPRGARVVLNGKPVGTTPMRIPELPIGSHVVRLELENHMIWSTSARVQAGQETRVTGSLEPIR